MKIDSIAFGGAGVGRINIEDRSFVVFVDDTVQGDRVKVKIGGKKRNHAFGYVEEVIEKSALRVRPKCKHFGPRGDKCGGCSLQNLEYKNQLGVKEQNVKDAIGRLGGFDESLVLPIIGCENEWFYRNKMEFSFSRSIDGRIDLGLHVRRRHHDVTELRECFLFADYTGDFVSKMRDFFREKDEMAGSLEKKSDESNMKLMSLVIREGKRTGEIMVNLIVENGRPDYLKDFTDEVVSIFNGRGIVSVYFTEITNIKGRPKKIDETNLYGPPVIKDKMQIRSENEEQFELEFEIFPQSFFQPNTLQAEKLYSLALDFSEVKQTDTVYDLYCGAGTIALAFSKIAKKVYGIELNKAAILNAKSNAITNGADNVEFLEGDVNKKMPELTEKPDIVLVDPPRGGLHAEVIEKICDLDPAKIVYVSCNPTTLARDLSMFTKTGYNLIKVQPVDMFPQTYHIECVALLKK